MALHKILQGEDKTIEFAITDGTDAIDLSTVAGILIKLVDETKNQIQIYNNPTRSGYKPIVITDSANGKIEIKLQSADTLTAKEGKLCAEVMIEIDDSGFDDSTIHNKNFVIAIAEIEESQTTGETDLTP